MGNESMTTLDDTVCIVIEGVKDFEMFNQERSK